MTLLVIVLTSCAPSSAIECSAVTTMLYDGKVIEKTEPQSIVFDQNLLGFTSSEEENWTHNWDGYVINQTDHAASILSDKRGLTIDPWILRPTIDGYPDMGTPSCPAGITLTYSWESSWIPTPVRGGLDECVGCDNVSVEAVPFYQNDLRDATAVEDFPYEIYINYFAIGQEYNDPRFYADHYGNPTIVLWVNPWNGGEQQLSWIIGFSDGHREKLILDQKSQGEYQLYVLILE